MAISRLPLGMNARNYLYIRKYNSVAAKYIADDKIKTKNLLIKNKIATPKLIASFNDRKSILSFDWSLLNGKSFVIKPVRGYGGEGILVFKKWNNDLGVTTSGKMYHKIDLESHLFDILDGAYSLQHLPDSAYIEEALHPSQFFKKLTPFGLADIRVIVFNKVPVMAMLRLPTRESEGKANIHLGAIVVGVDIRTGRTVRAILNNRSIDKLPGTEIKLIDVKVPDWDKILILASKAQIASKLGFAGIDIVIDNQKGPQILEINARPGLSIQVANYDSLRARMERLERIEVGTAERGVELAKSLFSQRNVKGADRVHPVLSVIEEVLVRGNGLEKKVLAKLDTGAYRSSIDRDIANELKLIESDKTIEIHSASGKQIRPAVNVRFVLGEKKMKTLATVTDRSHLKYQMIIGRKNLRGFLINPFISKLKDDFFEEDLEEVYKI